MFHRNGLVFESPRWLSNLRASRRSVVDWLSRIDIVNWILRYPNGCFPIQIVRSTLFVPFLFIAWLPKFSKVCPALCSRVSCGITKRNTQLSLATSKGLCVPHSDVQVSQMQRIPRKILRWKSCFRNDVGMVTNLFVYVSISILIKVSFIVSFNLFYYTV